MQGRRMSLTETSVPSGQTLLVAVYDREEEAQRTIEQLRDKGVAMDMLSVLGKVHPSGDDVLGIYYTGMGSRVQAWAKQGALWGSLWGLMAGAAAMFVFPGVGSVFAAGPIVEAIIGSLAGGVAGAAVGGSLGGTTMAGAAVMTHLASVMHRMGIPKEKLEHLHQAIDDGHFVLILREATKDLKPWLEVISQSRAAEVIELPFHSLWEEV